ncbi:hypothetical protein OSG_eHP25_00065 [environmental Halophage eHP-25]|nr:hypothetical protein OSG_eHP25_00065 [environmental Halophage eHP-25]
MTYIFADKVIQKTEKVGDLHYEEDLELDCIIFPVPDNVDAFCEANDIPQDSVALVQRGSITCEGKILAKKFINSTD